VQNAVCDDNHSGGATENKIHASLLVCLSPVSRLIQIDLFMTNVKLETLNYSLTGNVCQN
jgi:hypothetical protein